MNGEGVEAHHVELHFKPTVRQQLYSHRCFATNTCSVRPECFRCPFTPQSKPDKHLFPLFLGLLLWMSAWTEVRKSTQTQKWQKYVFVLSFCIQDKTTLYDYACAFWDEMKKEWSTRGCNKINSTNGTLGCLCNHTTNFAALWVRSKFILTLRLNVNMKATKGNSDLFFWSSHIEIITNTVIWTSFLSLDWSFLPWLWSSPLFTT